MRELTIQEVIKALPLEEPTQQELLKNYDSYDDGKKFEVSHICWNAFEKMKALMEKIKYEQFLVEVSAGTRKLSTNLMDEVNEAVWKDIEDFINGKRKETEKLDEIRTHLQQLINTHP